MIQELQIHWEKKSKKLNDNGFEYKMDHRQNPLEIMDDELTLAFNIQKQY